VELKRPAFRPALPLFHRFVLAAGLVALGVAAWKLDARDVLEIVSRVGPGILLLVPMGLVPPLLNAAAWRLAFAPEDARTYRFSRLLSLYLAMEGVNYLVPTGTVAGEVARATLLGGTPPFEVRAASVVTSRIAQTVAQVAIILAGVALLVGPLPPMERHRWIPAAAEALLALLALAALVYLVSAPRLLRGPSGPGALPEPQDGWLKRTPARLRLYFGRYRARFSLAVLLMAAAYAWNSLEAWWICRLIGLPVGLRTALTIEVLSVAIDGLFFIVPAKIGTQELGKVAVFSLLGLPARFGFAFGILRHLREFFWAIVGFLIYGALRREA
jgi:hypothetical protein